MKTDHYRLISIDPGSRNMGLAFTEVNLLTREITVVEAETVVVDLFLRLHEGEYSFGEIIERQLIISGVLKSTCERVEPHAFVAEDFYLAGNATAYRSLAECMLTAKNAVLQYNNNVKFLLYTASNIKKKIGVSGTSGDKAAVKEAVLKLNNLSISSDIDTDALDQHAWDAIAVGYCGALEILEQTKDIISRTV